MPAVTEVVLKVDMAAVHLSESQELDDDLGMVAVGDKILT
jgi:hypothetical protein